MKAKIFQQNGTVKGEIELPNEVFGCEVNEPLLHQVIMQYLANQRQGTAKTKTRSEVSGGGKKPWRQKGTGRARAGSNTSPIWIRGGKAFGAQPRNYYSTIPQKMKKKALLSALSSRANDERIFIVDELKCEVPKTKVVVEFLKALNIDNKKNLLIIDKNKKNVYLSGRNIKNVTITPVNELTAYDIINSENIIFGDEKLIETVQEAVTK